jgi:hypothetical protein
MDGSEALGRGKTGEMDGSKALSRGKTGVMDGSDTSPSGIGSSDGSLRKRIRIEHNISSQYIHKKKAAGSRSFTYWVETRILMLSRNMPPSGTRRFLLPAPLPALFASSAVFTGLGADCPSGGGVWVASPATTAGLGADRPSGGGVWVAAPATTASRGGRVGEVVRPDDGEGEDWRTGICEVGED